jgi:sugar phosphate isomerase/epimerase
MQRRQLLQLTAAASATAALAPWPKLFAAQNAAATAGAANRNGIGLQLWTVRNQLAEDIGGTLSKIVDAGYEQIELMNVLDSGDIVTQAKSQGLEVRSAFFNWQTIAEPKADGVPTMQAVIERADQYGLEHLVFGYIGKSARDTADKIKAICENTNKAAELVEKAGMKLSYHNHSFEFAAFDDGQIPFELMVENFDAEQVGYEVDVFWVAIGGYDPYKTMERLGPKMRQIHLKDLKAQMGTINDEGQVPNDAFQECGDGTIDMVKILEIADKYKVSQFHVEQDQSPDPIASIQQSRNYLKTIWS